MTQQETKSCQNCQVKFTIEPQDFAFYEKMDVPPPTFCPDCRFQRRLAWRNERSFFHVMCAKCQTKTLSVYPPDSGITIYCRPCWWSDDWDGLEYGQEFDPGRPFLDQLNELLYKVPLPDLFGLYTTLENSEYTNMVGYLKNCYMLTMADWDEDCAYGSQVNHSKDSLDVFNLNHGERCYECINCLRCYNTLFLVDCENCQNVSFSRNLVSCQDCIGCVNLRNKQYCIYNEQLTKEEYEQRAKDLQPNSRAKIAEIKQKAAALALGYPRKYIHERMTQDVSGDYIYESKSVHNAYMVNEMENARYVALVLPGQTNDCYDHTHYGISTQRLYETLQVGNQASDIAFSWFVITNVSDIRYSMWNIGGSHNFGCVGLKKKQYCILNKQYSEQEYQSLRAQIIKQMDELPYKDSKGRVYKYGEFFPIEMSPFPYNVSSAPEFFPLSKEGVQERGYVWRVPEHGQYQITVSSDQISDGAADVNEAVLQETFECAHKGTCDQQCSTAFRIIPQELAFYLEMGLPLPSFCHNCRHYERLEEHNPFSLHERLCQCAGQSSDNGEYANKSQTHGSHGSDEHCPNSFQTTFTPDRPEIVYCKQCYQEELA